jgi:hypothetical protein
MFCFLGHDMTFIQNVLSDTRSFDMSLFKKVTSMVNDNYIILNE